MTPWSDTGVRLLKAKGYSMQANKKTREGAQHPDRDAQFAHINETVTAAIQAGEPVISMDAKKRELIGDFKAVGREFEPKGRLVEVRGHDFKDKQLRHAIPYGATISPPTKDGRASGSPARRRSSRSTRSSAGGSTLARPATPPPRH